MIDDDALRRNLARRTAAGRPDVDEIAGAVAGRVGAVGQSSAARLRLARWRPIGAVASVAAAAVLVVAIILPSAPPPKTGASPTVPPAGSEQLLTVAEFVRLVDAAALTGSSLPGRVALVDASFSRLLGNCESSEDCLAIAIGDVPAYADPRIRNAPDSNGPFAVRFRSDRSVDLLGPLRAAGGDQLTWDLTALVADVGERELAYRLAPDVYLVDTWLDGASDFRCPAPFRAHATDFTCGTIAWIGGSPLTETGAGLSSAPDGLRVQNGAYEAFARDPERFPEKQRGLYVVRPLVEQPKECFLCPPAGAIEMLGRVESIDVPPAEPAPSGQPQSGDGWRLLGDASKGNPYSIRYATDAAGLRGMWTTLLLPGEPPAVDFDREIVVLFGATVSGSCPGIRFNGVGIDMAAGLVYGRYETETDPVPIESLEPGAPLHVCTADASPHGFLVAIARDVLPPSPFTLRLYRLRISSECCEGEEVEVDLGG